MDAAWQHTLIGLGDDLIDIILSHLLNLKDLLGARASCQWLRTQTDQRFLSIIVIAPPDYKNVDVLTMQEHGDVLIRLFGCYCCWLREWCHLYQDMICIAIGNVPNFVSKIKKSTASFTCTRVTGAQQICSCKLTHKTMVARCCVQSTLLPASRAKWGGIWVYIFFWCRSTHSV